MTITQEKEQVIQKWFDKMESHSGIYAGLDEIDEGSSISPKERIHEMFLKRLHGQTVNLHFPRLKELGEIESVYNIDFSPQSMETGAHQKFRFATSTGITGLLTFDWVSLVATFVPDGADFGGLYMYQVNHFHIVGISAGPMFNLTIDFLVDMSRLEDSGDVELSDDVSLSKNYIKMGVLHQKDGYMPSRPVTFKEIASVTGVTPSTLSDLKNGHKSIDNLTLGTFAVLSQYGHVRNVDSMIYDAFTSNDRLNDSDAAQSDAVGTPDGKFKYTMKTDIIQRVVMALKDGKNYIIDAGFTRDEAEAEYTKVVKLFNNNLTSMMLDIGRMEGSDPIAVLSGAMIPKDMVSHIYIDQTNSGYHLESL